MTSQTPQLSPDQIAMAQAQAAGIANAITSNSVNSNTFVFFAAFDGTDNGSNPPADGSGDSQTTAIYQLFGQVFPSSTTIPSGNVGGAYEAGVGTPGTLPFSSIWSQTVTAQTVINAQNAYNAFKEQATAWYSEHPGGSITAMIAGFSRGTAGAAVFAQILYENGLISDDGTVLIPPGAVGAVSAALLIDPVLTSVNGNMYLPPNVEDFAVVRALNEYRTLFEAADYTGDNATIYPVVGNHGDAGDLYDNGLGGIYLTAYTDFFKKAGLSIQAVPSTRKYQPGNTVVVHSEGLQLGDPEYASEFWNDAYNYYSVLSPNYISQTRTVVPYGTYGTAAAVSGNTTTFTDYSGNSVIEITGTGYNAQASMQEFIVSQNSSGTIFGWGDTIAIDYGATLSFSNPASQTTDAKTGLNSPSLITMAHAATLVLTSPATFNGTIRGFSKSDIIDLASSGTATGVTLSANNVLTVQTAGGNALTLNLNPVQDFSGNSFLVIPDGNGGTNVTAEVDDQPIAFTGSSETLLVINPGSLIGTISAFLPGDTIDLVGIGTATSAVLGASNVLTVQKSGGGTLTLNLDPTQDFSADSFLITPDGNGGTDVIAEADNRPIAFTGTNEVLLVVNPGSLTGTITSFLPGDTIDLAGIGTAANATLGVNNVLTIDGGSGGPIPLDLDPSVNYGGLSFVTVPDGSSGTDVIVGPLLHGTINASFMPTTTGNPGSSFPDGVILSATGTVIGTFDYGPSSAGTLSNINVTLSDSQYGSFSFQSGKFEQNLDEQGGDGNPPSAYPTPWAGFVLNGQNASASVTLYLILPSIPQTSGTSSLSFVEFTNPDFFDENHFAPLFTMYSIFSRGSFGYTEGGIPSGSLTVTCYALGTHVATPMGDVPVEKLREGDLVVASSGSIAPVVWLGYRHVNCRGHPHPELVWPVRVSAGSFGRAVPSRDLWLSPDHAVYVRDVLIPVKHLINGITITQVPVDEVTYYHVELPQHDLLLAEGLPCESYLDVGDRSNFENGGPVMRLFPDFSTPAVNLATLWEAKGCAPLVVHGPELEAARAFVNTQAAVVTAAAA